MPSIIKEFDPTKFGRWKDHGMFWDLETGEAINVVEHYVDRKSGYVIPAPLDESGSNEGKIIGGEAPGTANEKTIYIRTGYYFETNVTVNEQGDTADDKLAAVPVEPWGFARSDTAAKVYTMLQPYVVNEGGALAGFGVGDDNQRAKYSQLQRCINVVFDKTAKVLPAGLVAQRLAEAVSHDPVTGKFITPSEAILRDEAKSSAREARGMPA